MLPSHSYCLPHVTSTWASSHLWIWTSEKPKQKKRGHICTFQGSFQHANEIGRTDPVRLEHTCKYKQICRKIDSDGHRFSFIQICFNCETMNGRQKPTWILIGSTAPALHTDEQTCQLLTGSFYNNDFVSLVNLTYICLIYFPNRQANPPVCWLSQ